MPYEIDPHALWVTRFTSGQVPIPAEITGDQRTQLELDIAASEAAAFDRDKKEVLIREARAKVEAKRDKIQQAYIFDIQADGTTMSTLGKGGDQTQTVDPDEAGQRMQARVTNAQLNLAVEMENFFSAIDADLRQHKKTNSDDPLFTPAEIRAEIFTPLVREQLIPEQLLRKQFSDVQEMLDQTNDAYMEELKRYSDEDESKAAEDAKELLEATKGIADAIAGLSDSNKELKEGVINMIAAVATTGIDVYAAAQKEPGFDGVKAVIQDLGKVAKAGLPKPIGTAISLGINGAVDVSAMIVHLGKEGGPDLQAFALDIVSAVDTSIEGFSLKQNDKAKEAALNKIRKPVMALIKQGITSGPGLVDDVRDRNWPAVGKVVTSTVLKGLRIGFQLAAADDKLEAGDDDEKDEIDERLEAQEEALDEATELADKAFELSAERREELERLDTEELGEGFAESFAMSEDSLAELALDEERAFAERAAKEQRQYELALAGLDAEDPDANQLKSISALIAKMEKDRAILKMILAVSQAGVAGAEQFFSPMAAAGTLVGFIENLMAAVERAKAMRRWQASHGEAMAAVSPYATTISNFVKNQKQQFAQETIQAAFKVIKMGAQIAGSTGVLTHVAKVVEAGASLAATAEELIYKRYKRGQLDAAWSATEAALRNPNNRRLGLIARSQNPTLAKYSIAWGALVKRDAMAVSALSRIGLTRETLEMESTSVKEVKRYLETLYEDDDKLVREFDDGEWANGKPPPPRLDVKSWTKTVGAAKANGKLDESEHAEILRGLKLHARSAPAFDAARKAGTADLGEVTNYAIVLQELSAAFSAYRPLSIGLPSRPMLDLAQRFAEQVDARLFAVEQVRLSLADAG